MNRNDAWPYISFGVDDTGAFRDVEEIPDSDNVRLVGWQCGFEPLFVAVWSYLGGVSLTDDEAAEMATDLLDERRWFGPDGPRAPDYVI